MILRNLRTQLGLGVVAFILLVSASGCGSNSKKTVKVDGESYPECSQAVISDYNVMIRAFNRAVEDGLTAREREARLDALEMELRIYFERHLNEGSCAAAVVDSGETRALQFPSSRAELEARVKSIMDKLR